MQARKPLNAVVRAKGRFSRWLNDKPNCSKSSSISDHQVRDDEACGPAARPGPAASRRPAQSPFGGWCNIPPAPHRAGA